MKEIQLSKGLTAKVDDADFEWLNQWSWYASKHCQTFYARRCTYPQGKNGPRRYFYMHRIILAVPADKEVDHQDHDGLNNQRNNIRPATSSENGKNKTAWGASKYLGVCWVKSRKAWIATIKVNGKQIYGGQFHDERKAAKWYNDMAIKHHGIFANPNKL